jgi:hypothetical protein
MESFQKFFQNLTYAFSTLFGFNDKQEMEDAWDSLTEEEKAQAEALIQSALK